MPHNRCVDTLSIEAILANCTATVGRCLEWNRGRVTRGYGTFILGGITYAAHRAVLELKINRLLMPNMEACHTCDNPPCCNPEHLFEGTHKENLDDMFAKGRNRALFGENHGRSKLLGTEVLDIKMRLQGGESCASISREYKVSPGTIRDIKNGLTWKHIQINSKEN